jgi:hypothetical protein
MALDPVTGVARAPAYSAKYDLLEVLNGDLITSAPRIERNVKEWLALLRKGHRYVATGGSDAHRLPYQDPGYPRNVVYWRGGKVTPDKRGEAPGGAGVDVDTDDDDMDDTEARPELGELLDAVRHGRSFITTGPYVWLTVAGRHPGAQVKSELDGSVTVELRVEAAPWVDVEQVVLYEGTRPLRTFKPRGRGRLRLYKRLRLEPERDTWYVVTARGDRPDPTQHRDGVLPYAITNPVWVDADGDGQLDVTR